MNFKQFKPEVEQPIFGEVRITLKPLPNPEMCCEEMTNIIQQAIDDCSSKGGGHVILTPGIYLVKPIHLKSHVNLELQKGVLLTYSENFEDYKIIYTSYEGLETYRREPLLFAENQEHIGISGEGIIDGNGGMWRPLKRMKLTENQWNNQVEKGGYVVDDEIWWPSKESYDGALYYKEKGGKITSAEDVKKYKEFARPNLLVFVKCKHVWLQGVTFQNSPAWNIHPLMCEQVIIENLRILNPWFSQNGDGLDLESCKDVIIKNTFFDVGDDAICLKSGKNEDGHKRGMACENVWIDNCIVNHGHGGFVVGSEMSGDVRNIYIGNCTFLGTDVGIRFKSSVGRGGVVEQIYIENIIMKDIVNEAIILTTLYYDGVGKPVGNDTRPYDILPEFKDIYMRKIDCFSTRIPFKVEGLEDKKIHNIYLEDARLLGKEAPVIKYAKQLSFENVTINDVADINGDEVSCLKVFNELSTGK